MSPVTAVILALTVLLVLAVGIAVLRHRVRIVSVTGMSMAPTFLPGDRLLVRRAAIAAVQAGQVVIVEKPGRGGVWAGPAGRLGREPEWMIKRVAATPGDRHPGGLPAMGAGEPVVPAGKLLIIGDNPDQSMDSRYFGYIPGERLLGIVVATLSRNRAAGGGHNSGQ
jgi:signal peptidase I